MSSRTADKAKDKTGRKKLKLSKETLKDLTTNDKAIKGGISGQRPDSSSYAVCSF